MATIKVIIRPEKAKKNGEVPLYIRMTRDRKSKYISLRQSLLPRYWDGDRQRVRKSHPNSARLNAFIAEKRAEIEALSLDVEQGRAQIKQRGMREALEGGSGECFFAFAEEVLQKMEREERFGTAGTYRSTLRCFGKWLDKSTLPFRDIDFSLARRYRDYLENERGNKPATVVVKFATLKSMLSHAREAGVVKRDFQPFTGLSIRRDKSRKVIPSQDEMAAIEAVELKPGSNYEHVRNLYLFCANMAGLRFSDAITLRWAQVAGERLRWQTKKTNKQRLVYMPQKARDIISRYERPGQQRSDFIFPLLRGLETADLETLHLKCNHKNINCNATLRRICKLAGLERTFSFHTSRHYFATDSLRRGMRVEVLQHLLTHSSLNQTMEYAQIVNEDMDAAMMAYEEAKRD
jgi:integrase/recombinase XerD